MARRKRTLTTKKIAQILDVSVITLTKYVKQGCPHSQKGKAYLWNEAEVLEWLDQHGKTTKQGRPFVGGDNEKLREARLKLTQEQSRMKQLQREELEGRLHDTEECRARRLRQIYEAKTALYGLVRSMKTTLVGKKPDEIQSILGQEIDRILRGFAGDLAEKQEKTA